MPQASLFANRGFIGFFVAQFFGAFNDNLFKTALVVLITYRLADTLQLGGTVNLLVALASGLFVCTFFIFSPLAGEMADKYAKPPLLRAIKAAEIGIMLAGSVALYWQNITGLMLVLFAMGTQSAWFGPIKYAILPEIVAREQLPLANVWVEAGTFFSILLGSLCGSLLILSENGIGWTCVAVLSVAMIGFLAATQVPALTPAHPQLQLSKTPWHAGWRLFKQTAALPQLSRCVLAISWFWFVGAWYLTQIPVLARQVMGGDEQVVSLLLLCFSGGVALGAFAYRGLSRKIATQHWVVAGGGLIALFGLDLWRTTSKLVPTGPLLDAASVLQDPKFYPLMIDLIGLSAAGGAYCVPLYIYLQVHSPATMRARVVARNNVMNALFMVTAAILLMLHAAWGGTVAQSFLALGLGGLGVCGWLAKTDFLCANLFKIA